MTSDAKDLVKSANTPTLSLKDKTNPLMGLIDKVNWVKTLRVTALQGKKETLLTLLVLDNLAAKVLIPWPLN
jgi:hypothetical protein